ncbi:MAG: DUF6020 family protein [Lachnospiraceae bacterium]|nr:DUF6020 family protein [Lachnospiraceae bacterium]
MKKKLFPVLAGFLTAYAFRTSVNVPIQRVWYETTGDWALANVFELLGYYDFLFLLFWFVCGIFFMYMNETDTKNLGMRILSGLFAVLLPAGQSLRDLGNVSSLFGSLVNIIKTLLIIAGFFLFFVYALNFLREKIQKKNFVTEVSHFFSKKPFLKSFLILMAVYGFVDLICYPGNLNADTIGQIYQVYGEMAWSQHHPLVSTLIVGGFVKLGDVLFHSQAVGLFLNTLFQSVLLSLGLAATIWALVKKKLCKEGVWIVLLLYIITPVYTNIASTSIKDVPFMGFVLGYVVMFTLLIDDVDLIRKPKFLIAFIALQVMVMLLRNNGLYMIAITGFVTWVIWLKRYDKKGKLLSLVGLFLGAAVLSIIIDSTVAGVLDAQKGSRTHMLSLPMQMMGRYYIEHTEDITPEEQEIVERVLGPIDKSLIRYNPELADHIKCKFIDDCSNEDVLRFMGVWAKWFLRHPGTYIEATLVHTYGWYDPVVSAEKRYETPADDFLTPTGIFEVIDKGMVFIYRFLNRISLLGALENAGAATWAYMFIFALSDKENVKKYRILGIYMLVNLLICFASPAFLEHTRYGFPILFTVPFVFAYTLATKDRDSVAKQ